VARQIGGSARVVGFLFGVLPTVQLDHQRGVAAQEIQEIGAERDLPLPFPAAEATGA